MFFHETCMCICTFGHCHGAYHLPPCIQLPVYACFMLTCAMIQIAMHILNMQHATDFH